jgi:sugar O-acyltransferase (sialic acid O-acetyltransferase NeuD family)
MRKKIIIIGGGGFGREVFSIIDNNQYDVVGFLDKTTGLNLPLPSGLIGDDRLIPNLKTRGIADLVVVAIGNLQKRKEIFQTVKKSGLSLPQIIHSSATVLTSIPLGKGTIIYPGVVVMNDCKIGQGVLLNSGVTLGHDVTVGDFSSINPGAHIAGRIRIGKETLIGLGVSIRENVKGAGSLVLNDIPDNSVVYGLPAKIIRSNNL